MWDSVRVSFPGNDVETLLDAAARGIFDVESFLHAFALADGVFPVVQLADGGTSFPVLLIDERPYIAVYTSLGLAMEAQPNSSLTRATVRGVVARLSPEYGLAVNPGAGQVGLPIHASGVQRFLRATHGTVTQPGAAPWPAWAQAGASAAQPATGDAAPSAAVGVATSQIALAEHPVATAVAEPVPAPPALPGLGSADAYEFVIRTEPARAADLATGALREAGFTVTPGQKGAFVVSRGSRSKTAWFGTHAGDEFYVRMSLAVTPASDGASVRVWRGKEAAKGGAVSVAKHAEAFEVALQTLGAAAASAGSLVGIREG